MKSILFFFFGILYQCAGFCQVDCEALIHYRDYELIKEYDQAMFKYSLYQDALTSIEKSKDELLNKPEHWWDLSNQMATSEGGLVIAVIMKAIQMNCKLLVGIMELDPETGLPVTVVNKGIMTAQNVYTYIKAGEKINSIVKKSAEESAAKEILSKGGPLGKAVKIAWDYAANVVELANMPDEQNKLKGEVMRILDLLEIETKKYMEQLKNNEDKIKSINEIQSGITLYWKENCGSRKPGEEKIAQEKRIPEANVTPEVKTQSVRMKPVTNSSPSFYIFFTTDVSIGGNTYFLYSAPFLHAGELSDDMEFEKQVFGEKVKNYFPRDNWDRYLKEMQNRLPEIKMFYSEPYSTNPIKSKAGCEQAINAHMLQMQKTLSGLGDETTRKYIELN